MKQNGAFLIMGMIAVIAISVVAPFVMNASAQADTVLPTIADMTATPASPDSSQTVNVTAAIADDVNVATASLNYTVNNGTEMTVAMSNNSGTYYGIIPAQAQNSFVSYWIYVSDGTNSNLSAVANYTVVPDVTTQADTTPPAISGVTATPALPNATTACNITATVTDENLTTVSLIYTVNNGTEMTVTMTNNSNVFFGLIPTQVAGTYITYHVKAQDASNIANSTNSTYTVKSETTTAPVEEEDDESSPGFGLFIAVAAVAAMAAVVSRKRQN